MPTAITLLTNKTPIKVPITPITTLLTVKAAMTKVTSNMAPITEMIPIRNRFMVSIKKTDFVQLLQV